MAVSSNSNNRTMDDVFKRMTREGSTITKAEALAVYEEITQIIYDFLTEGDSVTTPLVNLRSTVSGRFEGPEDNFDPSRHQVRVQSSPGNRIRGAADEISAEKIDATERQPAPKHYHDHGSEEQDQVITPGDGARITGSLLKFDEEDEDQGIFFINVDDGTITRTNGSILKNKPGELIFVNPDLPAGTYRLEVRSNVEYSSNIRTGVLSDELSVAGS